MFLVLFNSNFNRCLYYFFLIKIRGWSRALIWVLVELCLAKDLPEVPPWLVLRGKIFCFVDNSGHFVQLLFYLSIDRNIKRLKYHYSLCCIYCVNVFWFIIQLAKRSLQMTVFLFLFQTSFSFSTFLEFVHPKVSPKSIYWPY